MALNENIIENHIARRDFDYVLDIGSGSGQLGIQAQAHVTNWIDLELSIDLLREDRSRRLNRVLGSAEILPFPASFFDAVIIKFALHHIQDGQRVFSEAARVLKDDGLCLLVDPVFVGNRFDRVKLAFLILKASIRQGAAELRCVYRTADEVRKIASLSGFEIQKEAILQTPAPPNYLPTTMLVARRRHSSECRLETRG